MRTRGRLSGERLTDSAELEPRVRVRRTVGGYDPWEPGEGLATEAILVKELP